MKKDRKHYKRIRTACAKKGKDDVYLNYKEELFNWDVPLYSDYLEIVKAFDNIKGCKIPVSWVPTNIKPKFKQSFWSIFSID